MSRSKRRSSDSRHQTELVDLPLTAPEPPARESEPSPGDVRNLPLFPDLDDPSASVLAVEDEEEPLVTASAPAHAGEEGEDRDWSAPVEPEAAPATRPATAARRVLGVLADLVVHLAVLAGGVTAMALFGLEPRLEDLPGIVIYLVSFSFIYTVVPLAFWGQTAGMAWAGIKAMDRGRRPLTFGQTALRWLSGVACLGLGGLPLLLSFTRRSFADRLSGSDTWQDLEADGRSEPLTSGGASG